MKKLDRVIGRLVRIVKQYDDYTPAAESKSFHDGKREGFAEALTICEATRMLVSDPFVEKPLTHKGTYKIAKTYGGPPMTDSGLSNAQRTCRTY